MFPIILCLQWLCYLSTSALAQTPVRAAVASAKTLFLIADASPAEGQTGTFRELRSELARFGRFNLVDQSDHADVTLTLTEEQAKRPAPSAVAMGAALIHPETAMVVRPIFTLTLRKRSTGEILWRREGDTVAAVLERLEYDLPREPTICIVVWCR